MCWPRFLKSNIVALVATLPFLTFDCFLVIVDVLFSFHLIFLVS